MIDLLDSNVWVALLRRSSPPNRIGPYDMRVASIAPTNGCTLVTHDTAEFGRVPGLVIEDSQVP